MRSASIVAFAMAVIATSVHAAQPVVPVTACGDVIPAKSRGVLSADLDCAGFVGDAVTVGAKATFDLGGFTLTGGTFAVTCDVKKCEIVNGTVTGASASGISATDVTIRNLTVSNHVDSGVQSSNRARAFDSTLSGNGESGIRSHRTQVERSTVTGNGERGVSAGMYRDGKYFYGAKVKYSTVTGNGTSPNCSMSGTPCGDIVSLRRPKLKATTCDTTWAPDPVPGCGSHWCVCSIN